MRNRSLLLKDRDIFLLSIRKAAHLKNPYAMAVYLYLLNQADGFDPSQNQIAKSINISRGSVIKALQFLVEYGILKKYHQGDQLSVDKYEFIIPEKEKK